MQQHTAAAPSTSLTQHGDQQNSQHNQQPAGYTTFGPGTPGTAILMAQNQENIEQQQQQPPPLGRKLNIGEFLLYNSLLFGMCFAKKGGPPVFACPLAGCCCMDLPPHFDVRSELCQVHDENARVLRLFRPLHCCRYGIGSSCFSSCCGSPSFCRYPCLTEMNQPSGCSFCSLVSLLQWRVFFGVTSTVSACGPSALAPVPQRVFVLRKLF